MAANTTFTPQSPGREVNIAILVDLADIISINLEKGQKVVKSIYQLLDDVKNLPESEKSAEGMTPYGISVIINQMLTEAGVSADYRVKAQLVYAYSRSGKIAGERLNHRYTDAEVEKFVVKFVKNAISRLKPGASAVKPAEAPKTDVKPTQAPKK